MLVAEVRSRVVERYRSIVGQLLDRSAHIEAIAKARSKTVYMEFGRLDGTGFRPRARGPGDGRSGAAQASRRAGGATTEEEERRTDEARSRERERTRGFRQRRIASSVMGLEPGRGDRRSGMTPAERKAVECHLDLRELHARGM